MDLPYYLPKYPLEVISVVLEDTPFHKVQRNLLTKGEQEFFKTTVIAVFCTTEMKEKDVKWNDGKAESSNITCSGEEFHSLLLEAEV